MKTSDVPGVDDRKTRFRTHKIDGIDIFYREAGTHGAPTIVLLHGFPTSSRMFRNLMPRLSDTYHLVAPDYPGFGYSGQPGRDKFTYNFDNVAELIEKLLDQLGIGRYISYMMDFGGSIGWRLAVRHGERVAGVVLQNAPLYREEGGVFWEDMIPYWRDGSAEHRNQARSYLTPTVTKEQYLHGVFDSSLIDPDTWTIDQALLDRPGVDEIMLDYLFDISKQATVFGKARQFLQAKQPPALIVTGANDNIFPEATMRKFLEDLPQAQFHAFDTGHFALEENAKEIADLISVFAYGVFRKGGVE